LSEASTRLRRRLPGDLTPGQLVDRVIRVDQAGEYGARRIYEGQLAVLPPGPDRAAVEHMARQEGRHLEVFDRMLVDRRVRPTALQPLWHVAGFALGAASAILGAKAAMACTVAVEEVIDAHYRRQGEALPESEGELKATIERFRAEEVEHRDTGLARGAEEAPGYELLTGAIKAGSRLAIWLAERI
jgi:ubiquinone biosynthesis monooxygenase Coq7